MPDDNPSSDRRLAMLIDGDNAQASLIGQMLAETSKYGLVTIRRIYGDWTENSMNSWKPILHTHAVQPIQQFRYTIGKNATDSAMIIDAMDILYTVGVDGFCLVSSDSDYTRLATRIREKNLFVMGIGKQMTPRAFVNACDVFVYTENLERDESLEGAVEAQPASKRRTRSTASTPAKPPEVEIPAVEETAPDLKTLLRKAFDLSVGEDGWAFLGSMGQRLRQLDPGFDPRTYGYKQLSSLLSQAQPDMFEIKKSKKRGAAALYVRLKEE